MLFVDTSEMTSDGGVYCTTAREKSGASVAAVRDDGTNPVSS